MATNKLPTKAQARVLKRMSDGGELHYSAPVGHLGALAVVMETFEPIVFRCPLGTYYALLERQFIAVLGERKYKKDAVCHITHAGRLALAAYEAKHGEVEDA